MPNTDDIIWFKQQFSNKIKAGTEGTAFTTDMFVALACQETGEVWPILRKHQLSVEKILELCVGDTLDASKGRSAFPKTKTDLLSKPNGDQMFDIARQALIDMASHITAYQPAANNPVKFCHGFGVFQYDLQFFLEEPDYFLQKKYADFDASMAKAMQELKHAQKKIGLQDKVTLTDFEMASIAIAYNTGRFVPGKGLRQGFFNGSKFYGEQFFDFLRLSKTVAFEGDNPLVATAPAGNAILPPPSVMESAGKLYEVDVKDGSTLRLRDQPSIDSTIKASLPDGQIVQAITNKKEKGFLAVETSFLGAHFTGFAFAQFLKPAVGGSEIIVETPSSVVPESGIVAVYMPRKSAFVTKRREDATAFSLNEPNQPGRAGTSPDELREEIAAIIDWLAVDKETNLRYQPGSKSTFCNIYTHDFCFLAGIYLPRVWWTPGAIEKLARGESIEPKLGTTIDEQRANDLYRWLRDFGLRFGWRQTGTLSKLQQEVNQGAIGLIVARRVTDGLSGHIVMVVPETNDNLARRNTAGDVIAPLQSQAGAVNFRRGIGKLNWWEDERFAEFAFWLHA